MAPVDDLRLVDGVAGVVAGDQAGGVAHRAVDVGDGAARAADRVVVVVADPALVPRHLAQWLDLADQPGVGEHLEHVVDGLVRRIQPAESVARYEARVGDNHHHVVCRSCGTIADVDCAVGETPCLVASDDGGFQIEEAEVIYWGRCPACTTSKQVRAEGQGREAT